MSSEPKPLMAASTAFFAPLESVTSSANVKTFWPYDFVRSSSCSGFRAVATTRSPRLSAASAIDRPKPLELPVTSQIFGIPTAPFEPSPAYRQRSSGPTAVLGREFPSPSDGANLVTHQ